MPGRKYSKVSKAPANKQSMVSETKPEVYGRRMEQRKTTGYGSSIAAARRRLRKPVKRSKSEITWALAIAGIGEGPADLSVNTREYRYSRE